MDILQSPRSAAEVAPAKAVAPKPQSIIAIETSQQAHTNWQTQENGRLEQIRLAEKANLLTTEFSQPIAKPEEAKKWEQLHTLSSEADKVCDQAYQKSETKKFDTLLTSLTADSPATPEKTIQADTVIENITSERRSRKKAGDVLKQNPDTLYLPATQGALRRVVSDLTGSVDGLLDVAHAKPDSPLNSDDLLKVATSETSPLEKDLKDQLRDTFDLVKGAKAQQLVNGLEDPSISEPKAALLKENHMALLSQITEISLNMPSLQDALKQHRKLLAGRGITNSDYTPDLSRTNFGEALAALSKRTEDPTQKKQLEALALGYATGIKFSPKRYEEKAGNVLMALLLDIKDPEAHVYDILNKGERRDDDILTRQVRRVFTDVVNYDEKSNYDSIFSRQNLSALNARSERKNAAQVKMSEDDEAQAKKLSNQLKAEAGQQKVVEVAVLPKPETQPVSQPAKKKGLLSKLGL
ncbi:MAG: hypothetical protein AAB437_01235 [Patescibacteria group bacterium]